MVEKSKIMYATDHALGTGFGIVAHNVCNGLADAGYEVFYLGWGFHADTSFRRGNYTLLPSGQGAFGEDVLPQYISQIRPEVLVVQSDSRMVMWLPETLKRMPNKPTWLFYPVIDGNVWDINGKDNKWPSNWTACIKSADKVVAMTKYGQKILEANGITADYIYHGVDTSIFKPISDENKTKLKVSTGIPGDMFVFGGVFKNMQRKNPEKYLQAFRILLESKGLTQAEKDKMLLLLHTQPVPFSGAEYDLVQQSTDYGLNPGKNIIFSASRIPMEYMPMLFQSMDVYLQLGGMEGFCNVPDTNIVTEDGINEIKHIKVGDTVLTHKGRLKKVTHIFKRRYKGKLIGIKRSKNGETIWLTPNHPVLAYKALKCETSNCSCIPQMCVKKENCSKYKQNTQMRTMQWIKAEDLKKWDIVAFPRPEKHNSLDYIDLTKYINMKGKIVKDGQIFSLGANQYGSKYIHPQCQPLPEHLKLTKEIMRFFGYFVADGCSCGGDIVFCFNKHKDSEYIEDVQNIAKSLGLNSRVIIVDSVVRIEIHSKIFAEALRTWFKVGAWNKSLPKWIFEVSNENLKALIYGLYAGDGSVFNNNSIIDYTSVSKKLLHQMYLILLRLGICADIKPRTHALIVGDIKNKNLLLPMLGYNKVEQQCKSGTATHFIDESLAYFTIDNIETKDYDGDVYNLGVDTDNSYTNESFTVHNCLPLAEAMSTGLPCIALESSTHEELLADTGLISKHPRYDNGHKISFGSYNGVECDTADPWDIAKKMERLYKDASLRKELGMKATERALKEFDWRIIQNKWTSVLKSLIISEDQIPAEWKKLYDETKV